MTAVIATFHVAAGNEAAFEAEVAVLRDAVKANEPGNALYQLTRPRKEPQIYKIIELYNSKDDFKAHAGSSWFLASFEKMKALLTSDPVIEVLEPIG